MVMRAKSPTSSAACVWYRKSVIKNISRVETNRIALEPENPVIYRTFAEPVISRPSRCAALMASVNAASRRGRGSIMRGELRDQSAQRQLVSQHAETAHHPHR